ncbi:unnamed protein product, partial [Nesidiocoris tenuis]
MEYPSYAAGGHRTTRSDVAKRGPKLCPYRPRCRFIFFLSGKLKEPRELLRDHIPWVPTSFPQNKYESVQPKSGEEIGRRSHYPM